MDELNKNDVEKLLDEELDSVLGGVSDSGMANDTVTIGWEAGEQARHIWSVVEGYGAAFNSWALGIEAVKDVIRYRGKEYYKASTARYHMEVGGSVTVSRTGGIS
jgi:hypothetical protein